MQEQELKKAIYKVACTLGEFSLETMVNFFPGIDTFDIISTIYELEKSFLLRKVFTNKNSFVVCTPEEIIACKNTKT